MKTYTVLPGDTLYGISKQFGISVDDIKRINNLQSNNIRVGQILSIPNDYNDFIYTVKKGDSLYSIAQNYNTTVSEIIKLNNLTSNNLQIGQILLIPSNVSNNYNVYTVQSGDSLYSIARKFNTTVNDIKSLNNLTSNLLSIGQTLKIPTNDGTMQQPTTQYINYIVKKGDSLYSIAKRFNMTVNELKSVNNLTSNLLSIGQVLKVKSSSTGLPSEVLECIGTGYVEPTYRIYTVQKGDSLYTIAKKFGTSVNNLMKLNNLTSTNLQIGQILRIEEV